MIKDFAEICYAAIVLPDDSEHRGEIYVMSLAHVIACRHGCIAEDDGLLVDNSGMLLSCNMKVCAKSLKSS